MRSFLFGNPSIPVESGLYSPTLTPITNVDAASLNSTFASYIRVGDIVQVYSTIFIDPTATGVCQVDISLPIAADFSGGSARANGVGASHFSGEAGRLDAKSSVSPHVLSFHFTATQTVSHTFCITASYRLN